MIRQTIMLKVVARKILAKPDDGGEYLRNFGKGEGTYRIEFNDSDAPCLMKSFKDPYSLSVLPHIDEKYVTQLKEGKTILVDEDVLEIA